MTWWHHQMETFSALLAICAGHSSVTGEFPAQRPVTWSFDVFFHLCLNKRLSKQSCGWWFETPSRPLWRHCNGCLPNHHRQHRMLSLYDHLRCRQRWQSRNQDSRRVFGTRDMKQYTLYSYLISQCYSRYRRYIKHRIVLARLRENLGQVLKDLWIKFPVYAPISISACHINRMNLSVHLIARRFCIFVDTLLKKCNPSSSYNLNW